MREQPPPIGLVIKQLDRALTEYVDKALVRHNVTRLHWQTLNVINDAGYVSLEDILGTMSVLLDRDRLDEIINDFLARGWINKEGTLVGLTDRGRSAFTEIAATQDGVRAKVMTGISPDDYVAAIKTLQKMIENVGGRMEP